MLSNRECVELVYNSSHCVDMASKQFTSKAGGRKKKKEERERETSTPYSCVLCNALLHI